MKFLPLFSLLLPVLCPPQAQAQVFDAPGNSTPPASPGPAAPQAAPKSPFGNEIPFLDPGSEIASMNGQNWNISNNRLFRARFEKYLSAPAADSPQDDAYRKVLTEAMKVLRPGAPGGPNIPAAVELLAKASDFPIDAGLGDSVNQTVYAVVRHKRNVGLLTAMNKALAQKQKDEAWNVEVAGGAAATRKTMAVSKKGADGKETAPAPEQAVSDNARTGLYVKNIIEIDAARVANLAKISIGEVTAKVEYQAMIVQLFLQRRYEHCIIAVRIYQTLFDDGSTTLKLKEGSDVDKMFTKSTGMTPTVTALDAMSSEAIRDVDEGVQSFDYLSEKGDLESASKRLGEAFTVGEYLPRIRTLARAKKERVAEFVRQTNQLISAIDVKDYTLAEELVEKLRKSARDFDYSKPRAAIETARSTSGLHIQQARSAAISKDDKAVAQSIREAALIWPTNPDLKAFSSQVAAYGDMNSRVLNDLDTLIAQKNYREIYREQTKYAGGVLGKPEYETKLKDVLTEVAKVEKVVLIADEMVKRGDTCGAWEQLEQISKTFPDDNEVNRRRAELSRENPEFISAVTEARRHEDNHRLGISLSYYLKAKRLYPGSLFAREGITRIADRILPENTPPSLSTPPPAPASPPAPSYTTPPATASASVR
ncbi:MAG: hypothetical protein V4726_24760 [Verrucomicrobiota bacterium]